MVEEKFRISQAMTRVFSLVLLALVSTEYRFLLTDCGSSGACLDAQTFNRNNLRENIENGNLGFPTPEPLGEGGPNLYYFLLGDDIFASLPWIIKLYSRRQLTRKEIMANHRISRGRLVKNAFGILVSQFRVLLGTMEQRPRVVAWYWLLWFLKGLWHK